MKTFLFRIAVAVTTLLHVVSTNAQGYAYDTNEVIGEMKVNIHAMRDFSKFFGQATNVRWVKGTTGCSVYFVYDGMNMRINYNNRGMREYMLKYYDEFQLPRDLRRLIKSTYYDYRITMITELSKNHVDCYLVKMENENEYLTIKVIDGDMSVFAKTLKISS